MTMLLRAALASLALLAGGAASAADLPYLKGELPPAPALPEFYPWSGFYAGGQIGYSWGSERTRFIAANGAATAFSFDTDAVFGGGHLGFNTQIGSFVVGVEGDIEALNADGSFSDPFGTGGVKRDWQASVRGRLGFAMDRFMIYATGGAAFTEFDQHFVNLGTGVRETAQSSRSGWTAGGGVAYAVTDRLIAGLEYRYTDFGHFQRFGRSAFLGFTTDQDSTQHALRTSLSYRF